MSNSPTKSKRTKVKPPKSRPVGTSAISQPVVEDASTLTALSCYSPKGDLFALLALSVDKHRLRIYNTTTGVATAETVVETSRVTALSWCSYSQTGEQPPEDSETHPPNKKRRKKRASKAAAGDIAGSPGEQVVVLGLLNGTLQLFSPKHARVVRTLSHPTSSSAILYIASNEEDGSLWTSSTDGNIRLWDAQRGTLTSRYAYDDRTPYSCLAVRPASSEDDEAHLLAANHGIHLLSAPTGASDDDLSGGRSTRQLASFTGHASPVSCMQWDSSHRFVSMAQTDRHVYVWDVPPSEGASSSGKLAASVPLDSDARVIALSTLNQHAQTRALLTLSASGKISMFSIPGQISAGSNSKQRVPTLEPLVDISVKSSDTTTSAETINVSFIPGEEGKLRMVRLIGGLRPVFSVIEYVDGDSFKKGVQIKTNDVLIEAEAQAAANGAINKRYNEPSRLAVSSGVELGQDASMDDLPMRDIDGVLDVNLAEMSLGQRLTAMNGGEGPSGSDSENASPEKQKKGKNRDDVFHIVPANSLTRTLIQALHSSDSRLLETCLAHSDSTLIRNTVQRLPPQLAVPLLNACVERLSRGPRANNMKGGGGGASSQRGTALITWVKAVLTIHSGHLMTMPDLVARLSGLHATLTTRLTLHESLLSLNGRLDMVLSQIEMRSSAAPAPVAARRKGRGAAQGAEKEVTRYVEGESEEEADDQMEVEVESGDDAGSVEDVELGGESEEDEDDEDEEEESDDEEGGPALNGFVDDEAEEDYDEDEEEDYSE
ncbi:NUC189-domain-containing protein [Heliocybe sulcata]|uniref:NUC189-domain-containing protein n=1 Tax=Heliocybe sulcata TaxID=5364 RepID=A0A5C3NJL8_9AGAM|nr:NUC189-domain-containing protein [Heliocybe sulcata]